VRELDQVVEAQLALSVKFGTGGQDLQHLSIGWSWPEDGFTWTVGEESLILLDRPAQAGDFMLEITGSPAVEAGFVAAQRVYVLVNRWYAGRFMLDRYDSLRCRFNWDVVRDHPRIAITLLLPDAYRPCDVDPKNGDQRRLALAVTTIKLFRLGAETAAPPVAPAPRSSPVTVTGPALSARIASPTPAARVAPPAAAQRQPPEPFHELDGQQDGIPLGEMMLEFENLGPDREFGMVQRACGAEPHGLLRFAEAPLARLLPALERQFEGIGELGSIEIRLGGEEFVLTDKHYGFVWPSFVRQGQANPKQIQDQETGRLDFLRAKLNEDLRDARKLLVYKRTPSMGQAEVEQLLGALRSQAPNVLLLVAEADAQHALGSVETLGEGLLQGYVAAFAADANPDSAAVESWARMCRAAHQLWRRMAD
jgi:hypothetical protein